ncbi:hypothetical protein GCM10025880_39520 [Methylorubrum aminovorans]|uniref:hypothetical protein n=1 Tax=Methylorubrum aminovorans TaxID=269069 RepID=UPI0023EA0E8F|nr:hypothetical protein [Methylorubrum aminovorans]GMA77535.1 hypothetical protein GCM10025880_39520 [Methylorubrum aminovorans]
MFDAVAASPTLADAADGLFMTEVKEYLGAGRVQTKLLVDGGFIKPMFPKRPELDHLFRRRDLDTFLTRLFADAVPVAEPDEDMVDIQRAVKKSAAAPPRSSISSSGASWPGSVDGETLTVSRLCSFGCPRFVIGREAPWTVVRQPERLRR